MYFILNTAFYFKYNFRANKYCVFNKLFKKCYVRVRFKMSGNNNFSNILYNLWGVLLLRLWMCQTLFYGNSKELYQIQFKEFSRIRGLFIRISCIQIKHFAITVQVTTLKRRLLSNRCFSSKSLQNNVSLILTDQ